MIRGVFVSFLSVLLMTGAFAQSTDAMLSGTVTDESEAVIAGATVVAQNIKTGVVSRTATNESGVYAFPALPPGVYRLSGEMAGFKKLVYNELTLEVASRLSINLRLEIGATAESIEVSALNEAALATFNSSVGGMLTGQKVLDLPLINRNALSLVYVNAGLVGDNFSGARIGTLNITVDGMNVQDGRINTGVASPIFTSVDRIEEFRIITSPADAEYGRGSGQIQMITRSGDNKFRGSLMEQHRNTVLNANTFFNNQRGVNLETGEPISPRNNLIRNQFVARVGGPIIKNRTFFHALYEGQRQRQKTAVNATTYTETARRGVFRFYPGVQNGNAGSVRPSVDRLGNPVRPAAATGDLQTVNLFGRDPNRMAPDSSGAVQQMLSLTPLPNNFLGGDGLNTAFYTWSRVSSNDFDQFNFKVDHNFNEKHRIAVSFNKEWGLNGNTFLPGPFPDSPGGNSKSNDSLTSIQLTSNLRPNLLNAFRVGALRPRLRFFAPWEVAGSDKQPVVGGQPYLLDLLTVTDPIDLSNDPQGRISPVYDIANDMTWLKAAHSFKGGILFRFASTNGFNSFDVMPRAQIGNGGQPIRNLDTIPGIGANLGLANNTLNNLAGSVNQAIQAFNSPGGADPQFLAGEPKQRTWKQREMHFYFKDDWKVRPNLTLNLGIRYEFYSVPWDANGKTVGLIGGSSSIFGLSGTNFGDMFQPGLMNGQLTRLQQVGRNSPNPNEKLFNNDWNNFAPAVGLTWALPWFGKDRTVLRAGYSIGYERGSLRIVDVVAGDQPGLRERRVQTFGAQHVDLRSLRLPLNPLDRPLTTVPLTDRLQIVRAFDTNLRNPYVQNWNLAIQRAIGESSTFELRYVGNKGTRLWRGTSVNETNIFETGILDAFLITQAGGHSPLLNRIFMGLNVPGLGVVDGVTRTGSDAVRAITTTQTHLAQNNVGSFADYLGSTDQLTGERGGLLRRARLPENFVMTNPQFASARLTSNFASSTYHSLQLEWIKRWRSGWTIQSNYTWSRGFGEEEGSGQEMVDSYRTLRNRSFDKRLMGFHRTHVIRNNGTYELPIGRNKALASGAPGWLNHIIGGWRTSAVFNLFSGAPLNLAADINAINTFGDNTPNAMAVIPKNMGKVQRGSNAVQYFTGLGSTADPFVSTMTTANNIRGRSTLTAITDASGNVILANPQPGQMGSLGQRLLEGPGSFRLDMNLIKKITVRETWNLELRADAEDVWNKPDFNDPNGNINSVDFGRITGAGGNRIVVLSLRLNF
ncbi:MAG: carboxypeptidase regulatory-like domain-containing protein [Acidimicrobiia bacterium]|nr:carboxypeptidase regulatory-like domain-containing protein [Acidimicrobiia bacterium]